MSSAIVSASPSFAQENPDGNPPSAPQIQYPVAELGNCKNEGECRSFCDKPANLNACLDFAEKNGLMPKEELDRAKRFADAGGKGPGGCQGKNSCDTYCNDINNIDECVSYAEKNGMMPPKELEEAKKVQAAMKRGVKPPACKNKGECDTFCSQPENMESCMNFALEAGLMDEREKSDAQKMLTALKRGVKPPPCKGKNECDAYCGQPENMEVCMNFALEAGMMDDKQKEESQKVLAAIKKGVKPPACRGPQECDAYCGSEEHFQECLNFAEAAGFMKPEEAEMARKTGGKGPGGCRKKEECEAFCNDPANQEACFNFAKDNGMIPPEELKRMEEGKQKFKESLSNMPEAVKSCLNDAFGAETVQKFMDGTAMPSRDIGDKMRQCFEKNMGPMGPGGPGMGPNLDQIPQEAKDCFKSKLGDDWQNAIKSGPAGEDAQECFRMMGGPGGPGGQGQGGQMGPGMLPENVPQDVQDCLKSTVGDNWREKVQSDPQAGQNIQQCFQKFMPSGQGQDGRMMGPQQPGSQAGEFRGGPGGCQSPEECQSYCAEHEEECKNFGPQQGPAGQMNPFGPNNAPGGPDPKEACAQSPNPEECLKNFQNMSSQGSRGGPGFMGGAPCSSPEECQKLGEEMKSRIMNAPNPEDCAKDPSKCGPPGESFMDKYKGIIPGGPDGERPEGFNPGREGKECRGEECMRQQPGSPNPGQPGKDAPGVGVRYDSLVPWTGQPGGPAGQLGPGGQPMNPQGQQMGPNMPVQSGNIQPQIQPGQPGSMGEDGRPMIPMGSKSNYPQPGMMPPSSEGAPSDGPMPQAQPMPPVPMEGGGQPAGTPPPPSGENPPPPPPSGSAPIRSLVGLIYDLFFPVLK